jgi:hypothetical protein
VDYIERNTVWGFNERVRRNFNVVNSAWENGSSDAHVVTQLILSLLGLIVFPCAEVKERGDKSLQGYKLDSLAVEGWPKWKFEIGDSDDLDDLVMHLRNAISHRRIIFKSDSRKLEAVDIQFRDRPNGRNAVDNWGTTINAEELQRFVLRFADLLKLKEQDNS